MRSWLVLLGVFGWIASPLWAAPQRIDLFLDQSFSGLQALNLSQLLQKQKIALDLSTTELSGIEVLLSGKGQMLVSLGTQNGQVIEIDQADYLDFVALNIPSASDNTGGWMLWLTGDFYIESLELAFQDRQPPPLPEAVTCPGVWGNVNFLIRQPFSVAPQVEVTGVKNYVWVIAGFGDQNAGPWLASYPKRSNFKGGATHWKANGENHWQYQLPRSYPATTFGSARVYFMADAVNDDAYVGNIVDWCDL